MSIVTPKKTDEVVYPSSDGEPMGETDLHVEAIILLREVLRDFFRDRPDMYVAADMFWYWEEGNPKARRAPDVMVVPGVGRQKRRSFFSWRENGARPTIVFEISSEKTWREDLYEKRRLYAQLGVKEYFLFDPEGVILLPQLQGFRLHQDHYLPLEADEHDRLFSEELSLYLFADGAILRFVERDQNNPLLTREEQVEKAQKEAEQERQRADQELQRAEQERQRAEQELHRAEHERQRAEHERERAEQERQRAEQELQRAEHERHRADSLAAEVARLRALVQEQPPAADPQAPPTK